MRTSSGVARRRIDERIALIHPDLPAPVVPAIRRCGILARSQATPAPVMSLPSHAVNGLEPSGGVA